MHHIVLSPIDSGDPHLTDFHHGLLSRNTVAKYLDQPEPIRSSRQARERPVWEAVQPRLEELRLMYSGREFAWLYERCDHSRPRLIHL